MGLERAELFTYFAFIGIERMIGIKIDGLVFGRRIVESYLGAPPLATAQTHLEYCWIRIVIGDLEGLVERRKAVNSLGRLKTGCEIQ